MHLPTIGLEIHVELKTGTKMFCACPNNPEEKRPNINVCPVCLAHPGTLPVMNKAAIDSVICVGLALGGEIGMDSHFDRKSYFYPDLPKSYQISQYEEPLVKGGMLKDIRIRRIHLEEDTGRLLHELPGGKTNSEEATYVDYNRAGVPLMELVTEPDVKNAEEAMAFAKELQLILRYLGVSDADMEKGQMRVEANISLDMGTKVEVKNINSFKAVGGAIEYEIVRQNRVLAEGGEVEHETRGWNEKKGITESQRKKEAAHDYRYFPEPDLPPLDLRSFGIEDMKLHIPELPDAKRRRFGTEFGLTKKDVDVLVEDLTAAHYFEAAASELRAYLEQEKVTEAPYAALCNYFLADLRGLMNQSKTTIADIKISPEHFAHLIGIATVKKLPSRMVKDILSKMFESGEDPETIMREGNMERVEDVGALQEIIRKIIADNPKPVADYKAKGGNAIQFLVGKAMAATKGQADPTTLKELFEKELSK